MPPSVHSNLHARELFVFLLAGEGHKHYVVNSESLEGVCVRHSDDCTPVCVPKGDSEPWRQRVCSKG